eukprot:gb/GEZJ01001077.1/.p1 GENE.gb/GEZJ01001077.1/~~gb/GEZJ01001077.1/.p1  ORF type:complete len:439 (-),score=38.46 gb/GEZJ01001077.1/:1793-3109(-)
MPYHARNKVLLFVVLLGISSVSSTKLPRLHVRRSMQRERPRRTVQSHLFVLQRACQSEFCQSKGVQYLTQNGCTHVILFDHLKMIKAKCGSKALRLVRRSRRFIAVHQDQMIRLATPLRTEAEKDGNHLSNEMPPARQRSFERISPLSFNENRTGAIAWDGSSVDLSAQHIARKCSTKGGLGVTVYVIDTGCRSSHEQLRDRVQTLVAPGSEYRSGEDDHGHGTHVAATIGGRDFGIAPRVNLVCIKALSERNEGSAHDVVAGVQLAIRMHKGQSGPGIISISLGGRAVRRYTVLDAAVNTASRAGLSFVVAAGNAGSNACSFTPGRARRAITVAAVDAEGRIASFSNSGECVSVGAPGVRVWSAVADEDDSYGVSSGTSMAAPFVSGLIALVVGDRGKTRVSTLRRWLKDMGGNDQESIPVVSAKNFCEWRQRSRRR